MLKRNSRKEPLKATYLVNNKVSPKNHYFHLLFRIVACLLNYRREYFAPDDTFMKHCSAMALRLASSMYVALKLLPDNFIPILEASLITRGAEIL